MPREIDAAVQASLEDTSRSEIVLCFLTVTVPNIDGPIRLVSEENGGVSFANGLPINYRLGGFLFNALPFAFERLSDDERPPRGALVVPEYGSKVGSFLRRISDPALLRVELYPLSGWSASVDGDNARNPTGTPELIFLAEHVFIRSASGGMSTIQCEIGGYDFTQEPLGPRTTKALCPDLYR